MKQSVWEFNDEDVRKLANIGIHTLQMGLDYITDKVNNSSLPAVSNDVINSIRETSDGFAFLLNGNLVKARNIDGIKLDGNKMIIRMKDNMEVSSYVDNPEELSRKILTLM